MSRVPRSFPGDYHAGASSRTGADRRGIFVKVEEVK
jgi:hypothetical protein